MCQSSSCELVSCVRTPALGYHDTCGAHVSLHTCSAWCRNVQADAQQSHASEQKDPGFGGAASGAMPEPPEQPHEGPNQKTPLFHMEVRAPLRQLLYAAAS